MNSDTELKRLIAQAIFVSITILILFLWNSKKEKKQSPFFLNIILFPLIMIVLNALWFISSLMVAIFWETYFL